MLFVTPVFPPMAGPSVYRTTKFAKYLPEFGWRPIVLCVNPSSGRQLRDEALRDEVGADLPVEGVGSDPFRAFYRASLGLLGRPGLGADFGRYRRALRIGLRLCRQHDVRALYVSAPPKRLPILGEWLSRATGLPLVNDFRDPPWQLDHEWRPRARQRGYFERAYADVFRASDLVIANTEPVREAMMAELGLPAEKIVTIPNGYDEADFAGVPAARASPDREVMQALCAGRMYKDAERAFATALEIAGRDPEFRARFRLRVLGANKSVAGGASGDSLTHYVEYRGHVDNREAASEMLRSDLNLVTCPEQTSALRVPQKLYPYMRAGRPILGLLSEGPARSWVDELGLGIVCEPGRAEDVAGALLRSFERWKAGWQPPPVPKPWLERFERRHLAGRLASCFDALADGAASPPR